MKNINGWLFLVIALVWLLNAINVTLGTQAVHDWIVVIAIALIGIMELKG
jgi:UDP-N-acetylmuramyl pentapeptide phosphotransferase/UDP-N-acetylglucosamine-1-phosphate transferase